MLLEFEKLIIVLWHNICINELTRLSGKGDLKEKSEK